MSEKRPSSGPSTSSEKIAELLTNPDVLRTIQGHQDEYASSGLRDYYIKGIKADHKSFEDLPEFLQEHMRRSGKREEHNERHETAFRSLESTGPLLVSRRSISRNASSESGWIEYSLAKYNPNDGIILPESLLRLCEVGNGTVSAFGRPPEPISDTLLQEFAAILERHFEEQEQAGLVIVTSDIKLGYID